MQRTVDVLQCVVNLSSDKTNGENRNHDLFDHSLSCLLINVSENNMQAQPNKQLWNPERYRSRYGAFFFNEHLSGK